MRKQLKKYPKIFLQWKIAFIFFGTLPLAFADTSPVLPSGAPGASSAAIELQILQVLTAIQTQLQTMTTQQTQLQQSFQAYTQYQLKNDYPSISFPGWTQTNSLTGISPSPTYQNPSNYFSLLASKGSALTLTSHEINKSQLLTNVGQFVSQPLFDSGVGADLGTYSSVLNNVEADMNQVEAQRLTNRLLLLNAKSSYLQYQQGQRLEYLLSAGLLLQAQQKPTEGVSK